ncbi:MAG: DNA methylase [Armatimonadia bacterium]|nr:DNA methylase [Armatimonadia bacterium]
MASTRDASPRVHPKNKLNDLPNGEWLRRTKSFWLSAEQAPDADRAKEATSAFTDWLRDEVGDEETDRLVGQILESFVYSITPPRDALKSQHPATFSEADIERLVTLFCKEGETVLDPFVGVGSALIAAMRAGRRGIGLELAEEWAAIARERIIAEATEADLAGDPPQVQVGDSAALVDELGDESIDFVVTSPPYWSILSKRPGMKTKAERLSKGLATDYGDEDADLGSIEDYGEFVDRLGGIFGKCLRVTRPGGYMAIIVSDFRHGARFYLYHADLAAAVEKHGWLLSGLTVLAQDNKTLYPYGIPYAFVSNVHHQYILVFRKPKPPKPKRKARSSGKRASASTSSRARTAGAKSASGKRGAGSGGKGRKTTASKKKE